jgi:hypothetical protein
MTTIWERAYTALSALGVPLAANRYLPGSDEEELPDRFIVYQLISSPPELHADNVEKYRSYRLQVTVWDRNGLVSLPDVAGAMLAAGFGRGPIRELPYVESTRHFGLAYEFLFLEEE